MPTGAKMLYIRDLGMATYNLLNFKMRPVFWFDRVGVGAVIFNIYIIPCY